MRVGLHINDLFTVKSWLCISVKYPPSSDCADLGRNLLPLVKFLHLRPQDYFKTHRRMSKANSFPTFIFRTDNIVQTK